MTIPAQLRQVGLDVSRRNACVSVRASQHVKHRLKSLNNERENLERTARIVLKSDKPRGTHVKSLRVSAEAEG